MSPFWQRIIMTVLAAGIILAANALVKDAMTRQLLAGIAGGLLGHLLRILTPGQFSFPAVFIGVAMMILGGMGSITGSIVGATIMTILPQFVIPLERGGPFLGFELPALNGLTQIVTALILIGVMLVKPEGLFGAKEFSWRAVLGLRREGEGSGSVRRGGAGADV